MIALVFSLLRQIPYTHNLKEERFISARCYCPGSAGSREEMAQQKDKLQESYSHRGSQEEERGERRERRDTSFQVMPPLTYFLGSDPIP